MIILLSKGNKLKKEFYHLYLHRTLTWSQVVGILEKSYEIKAVCVDFRGTLIEDEDLTNIETLRLARVPLCLVVDEDLQVENVIELSNDAYGFDIPVQVEYDDVGLAEYLSYLIGVDITAKVVRFVENPKKAEADLGDEDRQKALVYEDDSLEYGVDNIELDFETMEIEFDFDLQDSFEESSSELELELDSGEFELDLGDIESDSSDNESIEDILSDEDLLGDLDEEDILAGLDEMDM